MSTFSGKFYFDSLKARVEFPLSLRCCAGSGESSNEMTRPGKNGERSSATPNEDSITAPGSKDAQSSPLQKPHRKRPAHFPTVTIGFKSIIIFLTVCTRRRKLLLANDETARLIIESWQAGDVLACRSLCHHAGSHPFILRTKYVSAATFEEAGTGVLEETTSRELGRISAQVPIWQRELLGSAVASIRILRREVAVTS